MSERARPRVAVIGAGAWGRVLIRAILRSDRMTLVRVASRSGGIAEPLPEGVVHDAGWEPTLASGGIDAVVIASPPATHAEIALAALDAGLDLFIEKPLALERADAAAVLQRAKARGAVVFVDHVYLFHPAWTALKDEVWRAGRIASVSATFGQTGPFRDDVGPLWDWGPHVVSMCLDLFGAAPDMASCSRTECAMVDGHEGETLELTLRFGEAAAELRISNLLPWRSRRFEAVCGSSTLIFSEGDDAPLRRQRTGGIAEPVAVQVVPPLDHALALFADAVRRRQVGETPDLSGLSLAVDTVGVIAGLEACPG